MQKKLFPIQLKLDQKKCVIVGGGHVAFRRALELLETGAFVCVVAPKICDEIKAIENKNLNLREENFQASFVCGARLVICATNEKEINRAAALASKKNGALVNMAAPPRELSDFIVPAHENFGDLFFSVATSGESPALARALCQKIAKNFGEMFQNFLPIMKNFREQAKNKIENTHEREIFWRDLFDQHGEKILNLIEQGKQRKAEQLIQDALDCFGIKS